MSYEAAIDELFERAWYSTKNGLAPQFVHDIVAKAREADTELAALKAENERLREVVSDVAKNLGNGSFCAPNCSLEFMETVAEEVRLETTALRERIAQLENRNEPT